MVQSYSKDSVLESRYSDIPESFIYRVLALLAYRSQRHRHKTGIGWKVPLPRCTMVDLDGYYIHVARLVAPVPDLRCHDDISLKVLVTRDVC